MNIVLTYAILFLLLSNAVSSEYRSALLVKREPVDNARRDKSIIYSRVSITILVCSTFLASANFYVKSLAKGIGLFNGLFHVTSTSQIFDIFIFLVGVAILQSTGFYPRKVWVPEYYRFNQIVLDRFIYKTSLIINKMGEQFKINEYSLIILFILTGGVFLLSSSDLISIYLSIELQSYGLYLLSTIYRNSEPATNGGLTYFLLGGLSSCFILLGTSLLYANSGTTNLDSLYAITSLSDMALQSNMDENPWLNRVDDYVKLASQDDSIWYKPDYIDKCLTIFSVGLLLKVGAAILQFWSPDIYDLILKIYRLKCQSEVNHGFIIAKVQSTLVLIHMLLMVVAFLICMILLIDPSDFLMHVNIDAFGFEIDSTKDLNTCYMESTGNDSSGDSPKDIKGKDEAEYNPEHNRNANVADVSRIGEAGFSVTSPTDSESTGGFLDLTDECERSKEMYENSKERFKSAISQGNLNSAAEVARDVGQDKNSYYENLAKLNQLEDSHGYSRTGSEIPRETVTSYSESSDDEYFAKPDDSRPTTPGESTKPAESTKPGFVNKKK